MKYAEVHLPRMRLRMSELHKREEGKVEKILLKTQKDNKEELAPSRNPLIQPQKTILPVKECQKSRCKHCKNATDTL